MSEQGFELQENYSSICTAGQERVLVVNETPHLLRCDARVEKHALVLTFRQAEPAPQAGDSDVAALAEAADKGSEYRESYDKLRDSVLESFGVPKEVLGGLPPLPDGYTAWEVLQRDAQGCITCAVPVTNANRDGDFVVPAESERQGTWRDRPPML